MLCVVVLAALFPALGASGGVLRLDTVTVAGVALVFLLSGANLSPESLRAGFGHWRLHLLVQSSTFVMFPLLGAAIALLLRPWLPDDLLLGVFFLCALPSTVSTSIAMTSLARGNVAAAIFNATLSSVIGMLATPLLLALWLRWSGHSGGHGSVSTGEQIKNIALQLLLPFVLGQLLRPWLRPLLVRYKTATSRVDRGVIVLIVYSAFCDSTRAGIWTDYGARLLLETLALTGGLLALALVLTRFASRQMGFGIADESAAVFCGSKKSLANGIPMAKLLFPGTPIGAIVLPVMIYHQLQLLVCSTLARRYAERQTAEGLVLLRRPV